MSNGVTWWKAASQSPAAIRVLPFVLFALPIYLQGPLGDGSPYWMYALRTLLGAGLIFWMWRHVTEMRWNFSWEAVAVGLGVFVLWVGLDPYYPTLGELGHQLGVTSAPAPEESASTWNPFSLYGSTSALAWFFVVVRIVGSSLVVPPLEEVFYRSFLYRYLARTDFLSMPLSEFRLWPFVVVCLAFGLAHHEWLAGILCGFAYQGLVIYKRRLGDAMTAHAITNALLGLWVVARSQWQFW